MFCEENTYRESLEKLEKDNEEIRVENIKLKAAVQNLQKDISDRDRRIKELFHILSAKEKLIISLQSHEGL